MQFSNLENLGTDQNIVIKVDDSDLLQLQNTLPLYSIEKAIEILRQTRQSDIGELSSTYIHALNSFSKVVQNFLGNGSEGLKPYKTGPDKYFCFNKDKEVL